jgi:hypothetical protein
MVEMKGTDQGNARGQMNLSMIQLAIINGGMTKNCILHGNKDHGLHQDASEGVGGTGWIPRVKMRVKEGDAALTDGFEVGSDETRTRRTQDLNIEVPRGGDEGIPRKANLLDQGHHHARDDTANMHLDGEEMILQLRTTVAGANPPNDHPTEEETTPHLQESRQPRPLPVTTPTP